MAEKQAGVVLKHPKFHARYKWHGAKDTGTLIFYLYSCTCSYRYINIIACTKGFIKINYQEEVTQLTNRGCLTTFTES